jgi:hypothetical protein
MNFRNCILCFSLLFSSGGLADEAKKLIERMPVTDARNNAAEYAMTQGLIHSKIAEKCQKLPEPTKTNAKSALAEWRDRNQYLVTPTFFWVNYVAATNLQGQEYVYQTLTSFDEHAKQVVKTAMPSRKPDVSVCNEWLAKFSDASLDLKNSEHAISLQEIREYSYKFSVPAGR